MTSWRTLESRTVLERGPWLSVEERRVELPDGRVIDDWSWIVLPSYVTMVVVTTDRRVLSFRQLKYAVQEETLAPVAGYMEEGEDPLTAAERELLEETGYVAESWRDLGTYVVDANRGSGVAHLFLGTGARQVTQPDADDLEEQELITISIDELRFLVTQGSIKVLSWVAAAALALLHLEAPS